MRADGARAADGLQPPDLSYELAVNSSVPAELVPVLYQLLSGVVDATACRQLNMSPRTFSRRVADVLEQLGVATRFQGGAECGRRAAITLAWQRNQERTLAASGPDGNPAARIPVPPLGWRPEGQLMGVAEDLGVPPPGWRQEAQPMGAARELGGDWLRGP
jgi:hypothetical protein